MCLVLIGVCAFLYHPLPGFELIAFKDAPYLENPAVQAGLSWEGLRFAFSDLYASGNWHPLTWLSLMAGVQIHGVRPGGHLATNIALHAVNAVLLFVALNGLTSARWPSAAYAALFAVHPVNVETVAWLPERKDLLVGLFWMLSMLAYRSYLARPVFARYALLLLCFGLGLMSKPMMITFPLALLLLDLWPLGRFHHKVPPTGWRHAGPAWRGAIIEKIPLLALSAAGAAVNLVALEEIGLRSFEHFPLGDRIANVPVNFVRYLFKICWPYKLAYIYPAAAAPSPLVCIAGAAILLAAITFLCAVTARRRPALAVGWFWFLGTLFPAIGLVQVNEVAIANRYCYMPLIGLSVAAVWGQGRWRRIGSRRIPAWVFGTLGLAALASVTPMQLGYWRDGETLMRHDLSVTSENWLAEYNLGTVLQSEGKSAEAMNHYRESLRIKPEFVSPHINLGNLLLEAGDDLGAWTQFSAALRIDPGAADAINNIGSILFRRGDFGSAAGYYRRAIGLKPDDASGHYNLGLALLNLGKHELAASHFSKALRLQPDYAEAHFGRGLALEALGRRPEALRSYREALRIRPDQAQVRERLSVLEQ